MKKVRIYPYNKTKGERHHEALVKSCRDLKHAGSSSHSKLKAWLKGSIGKKGYLAKLLSRLNG